MIFGLNLPNYSSLGHRDAMIAIAGHAEELGYSTLWTSDHILLPAALPEPFGNLLESFTILSYLAGRTERIGLAAESWCSRSATRCWWLSRQRPFTTSAGGSATGIKTSIPSARLPLIQTSESDLGGPAVDEQLGAGDETGIIRSEEGDGFRGFLRAAQTAHGCG